MKKRQTSKNRTGPSNIGRNVLAFRRVFGISSRDELAHLCQEHRRREDAKFWRIRRGTRVYALLRESVSWKEHARQERLRWATNFYRWEKYGVEPRGRTRQECVYVLRRIKNHIWKTINTRSVPHDRVLRRVVERLRERDVSGPAPSPEEITTLDGMVLRRASKRDQKLVAWLAPSMIARDQPRDDAIPTVTWPQDRATS